MLYFFVNTFLSISESILGQKLKAATLQKLSVGGHTVTVNFKDGKTSTGLTIKAAANSNVPRTDDNSGLGVWFALMIASLLGMVLVLLDVRRARLPRRSR